MSTQSDSWVGVGQAVADLKAFAAADHVRFGTGWSVDDTCGQPGVGELALVWARSSCGKSTLFLNIIRNTPDVPTLVVNMEMTPRRQAEWLCSMTFDLEVPGRYIEDVLRWGPDDSRYAGTVEALDMMESVYPNLTYKMATRPSVQDLAYLVEDIYQEKGIRPQRVFIDHMGLMKDCFDYRGFTATASLLHSWAMEEGLLVFALQQTGRGGGEDGRNDGHLPVTLSSGVFGGEADADWIYGLYRPEKHPKYAKPRELFKSAEDYYQTQIELDQIKGKSVFQVVKNRPYGDTLVDGVDLWYQPHSRRMLERGSF